MERSFLDFNGNLIDDVESYVNDFICDADEEVGVYVGTDSQVHSNFTRYVTVVALHTDKRGGAHVVYHKNDEHRKEKNIFNRLWQEVVATIEVADNLRMNSDATDIITHFDINPSERHKSHVTYKAARGFAENAGFPFLTKPDSWAATCAADKLN